MPINFVCEYNKHMYNATDPIETINVYAFGKWEGR